MGRLKNYFRPFLSIKFLICFGIAWMITNGWSYAFIVIGAACDINWMLSIGVTYQAFLWMPFTPEKLITIPIAMWLNFKLFKDEKNATLLRNMKQQAIDDWNKIKHKFKRKKQNDEPKE